MMLSYQFRSCPFVTMMVFVRFGEMTFEEVAVAATAGSLVVLPTGCTEQQGPHLPVDFDTWFAEAVINEAATRLPGTSPVLVLPAIPFGPTPEHRGFGAGFIDVPVSTYDAFVRAVVDSLADQGFTRILIWRGCGGHDLQSMVGDFNDARDGTATAFLPLDPFHEIWCSVGDPGVPGGHADSFTTSIVMARRPNDLRLGRIPPGESAQPDLADPELDFTSVSATGVVGSAAHASAELGHQLWEASIRAVADTLRHVADRPEDDRSNARM